ncbi:hypothetical protein ACHHV8_23635 [Paenibacillus sp. TAB 01]
MTPAFSHSLKTIRGIGYMFDPTVKS